MTMEHVGDNYSVAAPAVVGQEEGDSVSIALQTSQIARLDDRSGPSDTRQIGDQQDSTTQQYERPLPPDEPFLLTASPCAEALEPTSGDPDLPLDVPRIGEGSHLSNEIVEVVSPSEFEVERLRVAQRKGKARA